MKDKYFAISINEDGEWNVDEFNALDELIEEYGFNYSEEVYGSGYCSAEQCREKTSELDGSPGMIIIKGHIIVPIKKQVVTKWAFEEDE